MQKLSSEMISRPTLTVTYVTVLRRQALERLMDDGTIYSTIDEAHFQISL
jgi:hypothetical protein